MKMCKMSLVLFGLLFAGSLLAQSSTGCQPACCQKSAAVQKTTETGSAASVMPQPPVDLVATKAATATPAAATAVANTEKGDVSKGEAANCDPTECDPAKCDRPTCDPSQCDPAKCESKKGTKR